jgi:hypothetical protein
VSIPAYTDCFLSPPPPSKIPDAQTVSQQELATAMQTMKEYNSDVGTYLSYLDYEHRQNHMTGNEADRLHNSAVETLTRIVNRFNEQGRKFNAKNG